MGILASIFGSSDVIKSGMKMIDDAFYTESEKAEDKMEMKKFQANHRIELMNAYAPFKLAQRVIAFGFVFVFLFIMLNGIIGSLYGFIDIANVKSAREFADSMWLGEIVIMIVSFYFGGGLVESIKRSKLGK